MLMDRLAQTTLKNQRKGAIGYMIKTYVIDTNVLIQAPYAIECFEENNLVLPLVVLEELEHAFLEIDAVCYTRRPMGFTCVVEQPGRFLEALEGDKVFDTLVPRHMSVCIVVHDQDRGSHLVHIEQGRVFDVLQGHFPNVPPDTALPVFILHGTV